MAAEGPLLRSPCGEGSGTGNTAPGGRIHNRWPLGRRYLERGAEELSAVMEIPGSLGGYVLDAFVKIQRTTLTFVHFTICKICFKFKKITFMTITLASGTAQGRLKSADNVLWDAQKCRTYAPRPSLRTSHHTPGRMPSRAPQSPGPRSVLRRARQALPCLPSAGGPWVTHKVTGPQRAPGRSSDDSRGHGGCIHAPSRAWREQR